MVPLRPIMLWVFIMLGEELLKDINRYKAMSGYELRYQNGFDCQWIGKIHTIPCLF